MLKSIDIALWITLSLPFGLTMDSNKTGKKNNKGTSLSNKIEYINYDTSCKNNWYRFGEKNN